MPMRRLFPKRFRSFAGSEIDWKVIAQHLDRQWHGGLAKRYVYEPPQKSDWGRWVVNIPFWISKIKLVVRGDEVVQLNKRRALHAIAGRRDDVLWDWSYSSNGNTLPLDPMKVWIKERFYML